MICGHIYRVRNCLNGKGYVGKTTKTLIERWQRHICAVHRGSQTLVHNAVRKYGVNAFDVEVLFTLEHIDDELDDRKLLDELERAFIVLEDTHVSCGGYNLQEGGEGGIAGVPEEHARRSGKDDLEHAKRCGKDDPEHVRRCMAGVTQEEHARRCMAGVTSEEHAKRSGGKCVRCVELNRMFVSAHAAQRELRAEGHNVRHNKVGMCANGKLKTHADFTWTWV